MFPKSTTTVAMSPEKLPANNNKGSTVVYMMDEKDFQVQISNDKRWRIKQAAICACAIILTTLILVAGTLGAITIVLTHRAGTTAQVAMTAEAREPLHRGASLDTSNDAWIPDDDEFGSNGVDTNPRILIDNGGLLPPTAVVPAPASPDLVAVDDTDDFVIAIEENGIKIDDADDYDNDGDDGDDDDDIDDDDNEDDDRGTGPVASGGEISSGDGMDVTDDVEEDHGSGVSSYPVSSSTVYSSDPYNVLSDYYYDSQ